MRMDEEFTLVKIFCTTLNCRFWHLVLASFHMEAAACFLPIYYR